jgi:hypothetical protein
MKNYFHVGNRNYVVFSIEQISLPKHDEEKYFQGFWKRSLDGACSKYENGAGIVFKGPQYGIYPHFVKLEFSCTNNEEKITRN